MTVDRQRLEQAPMALGCVWHIGSVVCVFAIVAVIALIIAVTAGKEGGSGAGQHRTEGTAVSCLGDTGQFI